MGAALLAEIIREYNAFARNPVNIRSAVAHDSACERADVRLPNVITPDYKDVGLARRLGVNCREDEEHRNC